MQVSNVVLGIAEQTALGSAATNPDFAHGLVSGGIVCEVSQGPDAVTSSVPTPSVAMRDKVENGANFATRAWHKATGEYLIAALGDCDTTGSSAPYTHVITLTDLDLPYLTVFEQVAGGVLIVQDCKVASLGFEWEGNAPLTMNAELVGGALTYSASITPVVDETDSADYFTPVGGTFSLDVDSATPVVTPILKGSVKIDRSTEPQFYSGSIEATGALEGPCTVEVSFTITPADLAEWRTIVTGADDGAATAATPVYGSFECIFEDADDNVLTLEGDNVAFMCDLPEADPEGAQAEVELSGVAYLSGTTPITATLENAQSVYPRVA